MRRFGVLLVILAGLTGISGAYAQDFYYVTADEIVAVTPENQHLFAEPAEKGRALKAGGVTYNLVFDDVTGNTNFGFDDPTLGAARRASVDAVMAYVLSVLNLNSGADLDIRFNPSLNNDNLTLLAQAGTFFSLTPGFTNGVCYEHLVTGTDPSGSVVDITATVNFGYNWNSNHTQAPSGFQYDLYTVLLHEITHGLGLLSLSEANGTTSIGGASNIYTYWDSFVARSNGTLLFTGSPPSFTGVLSDLTSNNLVFTGSNATAIFGGTYPRVYVPNPWEDGSSMAHWNANIEDNVVMTPFLGLGDRYSTYSSLDLAALKDIGYSTTIAWPVADFTAASTTGTAPFNVTFNDASTVGGSAITSYLWEFGDGATSTSANPSHTYASIGTYTVRLTVRSAIAVDETVKTGYITVAAGPVGPTANFSATPTSGGAPLTVTFTDTSSAGTEAITSRLWTFGDGDTSTAQNPTHTYLTPGAYTVSLEVTTTVSSDTETKPAYINAAGVDTDGDGLFDHEEGLYSTDPGNPDTDGDGLSDGDEVNGVWGYVTDPLLADTDGDGVNDYLEIVFGYSPLSAAETPELASIATPFFVNGQ